MYDQTTKSFTLRDASGSYAWLWENMDAADCASMTDDEIYAWVDEQISHSKEMDTYAIEERAETLSYPVFGYTTAEKFENADEYIAFKIDELNSDMQADRESAFSAIKAWIAENSNLTFDLEGDGGSQNMSGGVQSYSSGTRAGVERHEDGWYYVLDGVGRDGNYFETDDIGPFDTRDEAVQAARDHFNADDE